MPGRAYIFRRRIAVPLPNGGSSGHVGWAFSSGKDGEITCGATENHTMRPWVAAGEDNGAWIETVPDAAAMELIMKKRHYEDYKTVDLPIVDIDGATKVAENNALIGYSFSGNNCLDHAYQVLCHYGAILLPLPTSYPLPNAWFSAMAGEYRRIGDEISAATEDGKPESD